MRRLPLAAWLALDDIHGRYRRTVLGPLWIAIGQATMIAGFAVVFSGLFHMDPAQYLLYLAAGFPVWTLISQYLIDMPNAFIAAKGVIESYELPWLLHVWRRSFGYLFTFFHHLLALVVAMLGLWAMHSAPVQIGWQTLLVAPALLIVLVAGAGAGALLGVMGARYRDLQPAMQVATSFLMLLSPVVWHANQLSANLWIVHLNPIYYFLVLVREPLLGRAPPLDIWLITTAGAVFLFVAGLVVFAASRKRLYHWL
ncbi:MAG: ABC transporter permease [Vitreimonas sp.]